MADALDYIYIANSMNDKAFLIAEPRPEDDAVADEQDEDFGSGGGDNNNNNHYYNDGGDSDFMSTGAAAGSLESSSTPSSSLATAALAAAAASASVAAAAARITAKAAHRALATGAAGSKAIQLIDVDGSNGAGSASGVSDNNYTNVAVGLGAMLLNESLLLEGNETGLSIFGELVNGSGQQLLNASAAINVTASKVAEDDFTQLLRMAVTTVLLGLMILVTIIGKSAGAECEKHEKLI